MFTYGDNSNADFQLQSLATMSHSALQTLQYDCKKGRSAHQLIGHNGAEIPVRESFQNLLQTVDVELNCEVCWYIIVLVEEQGRLFQATWLYVCSYRPFLQLLFLLLHILYP